MEFNEGVTDVDCRFILCYSIFKIDKIYEGVVCTNMRVTSQHTD